MHVHVRYIERCARIFGLHVLLVSLAIRSFFFPPHFTVSSPLVELSGLKQLKETVFF